VRLLYTSTKDLLNAFVGEKRRFDKPVLVRLSMQSEARMVGFVSVMSQSSVTVMVTSMLPRVAFE